MAEPRVGVRWTVGDVSALGFEALQCSLWGARRVFGSAAAYLVCVNSVSVDEARRRTGAVPDEVSWRAATDVDIPPAIAAHLDGAKAEGVGWKFAHLHAFPDRHELALDNDCILWAMPPAIRAWLDAHGRCAIAEDVRPCFGGFTPLCPAEPRNSGIRGLPPGFPLEERIVSLLLWWGAPLTSELDEQGLQVALVSRESLPFVVDLASVTICSPFPPHLPRLGRCGAHFVGLNAKSLPWSLDGRPATDHVGAHWLGHRDAVRTFAGVPG
jgi:hypothetical protein